MFCLYTRSESTGGSQGGQGPGTLPDRYPFPPIVPLYVQSALQILGVPPTPADLPWLVVPHLNACYGCLFWYWSFEGDSSLPTVL